MTNGKQNDAPPRFTAPTWRFDTMCCTNCGCGVLYDELSGPTSGPIDPRTIPERDREQDQREGARPPVAPPN